MSENEDGTMLTLAEIIQDLHALEARLRAYERKYGITSADFYALYQAGLLDDEGFEQSTEFARWASAYTLQLKRDNNRLVRFSTSPPRSVVSKHPPTS
jgi:hypothetical protein